MKTPEEIIAYELPTFADCYQFGSRTMPTMSRLLAEARKIIAALESEGYVIEKKK